MKKILIVFLLLIIIVGPVFADYGDVWNGLDDNTKALCIGFFFTGIEGHTYLMGDFLNMSEENGVFNADTNNMLKEYNDLFYTRVRKLGNAFWIDKFDEYYENERNNSDSYGEALFFILLFQVGLNEE